ncbi:MAG: copper oxidase [Deltaproteobacteria bacterium]|nr:copper oxidase [Deltaproteobacteria bacterium]
MNRFGRKLTRWPLATAFGLLAVPLVVSTASAKNVTANVVALDHSIMLNRLGAMIPNGMIYALKGDVVPRNPALGLVPGNVQLRSGKRPRPIVLRMNVGDTLTIHFENLLTPLAAPGQPATRTASVQVMGLSLVGGVGSMGSHVGRNRSSLVPPGGRATYSYTAEREGAYLLYSGSTLGGGEEGTGAFSVGLFGTVNVQPVGAEYYRSQVTEDDLSLATIDQTASGHPIIDYDAVYPAGHPLAGRPILKMLTANNELVHSDINAIITGPGRGNFIPGTYPRVDVAVPPGSDDLPARTRLEPYREFTIVFHDEINATQAFPQFTPNFTGGGEEEGEVGGVNQNPLSHTLHPVRDAFAVNYGTGGIGSEIIGNRLKVGPMWDCTECKFEEFFLTSWAVGDPAMVVDIPAGPGDFIGAEAFLQPGPKATKAFYADDPSNVFHSYLNDHVKMRNVHAGKEHHMFHLHAHQWLFTPDDDNSNYVDVQGLGPGASYTYEIAYNGSGNRNLTAGDSIFHCHFYPHFAMGMWALWRVHDVLETGTQLDAEGRPAPGSRALPDAEIATGTPIPAVVPLPGRPMPPRPGANVTIVQRAGEPGGQVQVTPLAGQPLGNPGYPFFIPGIAGHRPPRSPLDTLHDGGLPRHVVTSGIEQSVYDHAETRLSFDKVLIEMAARELPESGTPLEQAAMSFHALRFHPTFYPDGTPAGAAANDPGGFKTNGLPPIAGAPFADPCVDDSGEPTGVERIIKGAAFQFDMIMNKVGWHFNQARILAHWQDVEAIMNKQKAPEPFFFRANSNDCITFHHTNLVPNVYQMDDYQVRTPTDIIGQHIHLVKFDVTSSDGSGNGWNYEDGTFSPHEVRERIEALNHGGGLTRISGQVDTNLQPVPHPDPAFAGLPLELRNGAQTTLQRWYADRTMNNRGEDRTLGTVFTHDHFGPSTHQQAGLYAFLGVEPEGSQWLHAETGEPLGVREDGGPTSFQANIIPPDSSRSFREFFMFTADFQQAYAPGPLFAVTDTAPSRSVLGVSEPGSGTVVVGEANPQLVINGPAREQAPLPIVVNRSNVCPDGINPPPCPEAISAADPGTMLVNYRNEPIAHRIYNPATGSQSPGLAGDLAFVYRSDINRANPELNVQPDFFGGDFLTTGAQRGDPFTPLLKIFYGDRVVMRLGTGATEESHNAAIHGAAWLQETNSPNSGYINHQHLGIAEHFELNIPLVPTLNETTPRFPFTDFLYKFGASVDDQWNGTWGILRAYDRQHSGVELKPLPNNPPETIRINNAREFNGVCPRTAPVRRFDVTAVAASEALPPLPGAPRGSRGTLVYNSRTGAFAGNPGPLHDPSAILYVRSSDLDDSGRLLPGVPVEPLILRAAAGECIDVTLRNRLPNVLEDPAGWNHWPFLIDNFNANQVRPSTQVGLHAQLVAYDVSLHDGTNVGLNPNRINPAAPAANQTVGPGGVITYRWYAGTLRFGEREELVATPVEFGATNLIPADPMKHSNKGAVGALIIEPRNAQWLEDTNSRAQATVFSPDSGTFREFVLMFQDDVNLMDANRIPIPPAVVEEGAEDSGNEGLNYRAEPLWFRLGYAPNATGAQTDAVDFSAALSNSITGGADPQTPVFLARARHQVRFRVLKAGGHARNHVPVIQGHGWERLPYQFDSTRLGFNSKSQVQGSQEGHGPYAHWNLILRSAGGRFGIRGDYLYRDFSSPHFVGGVWGILRVN